MSTRRNQRRKVRRAKFAQPLNRETTLAKLARMNALARADRKRSVR